jgi:enamine deaminase RidA (YjgF/YER057c/UK114 family)
MIAFVHGFFVQNVDVNYKGLVEARKMFFSNHDLNEQTHYITSTGIEGRHAQSDIHVLFDAYAVKGLKKGQQKFLQASTHLNPTYQYGVTFERGVKVLYEDRDHILISGTASINKEGDIVDPGNITGQTERMLENIKALLLEADASFEDLVQMIVYLRDISDYQIVNSIFEERFPDVPKIITLAPVCRPGWLIETECIAVKESNNPVLRAL